MSVSVVQLYVSSLSNYERMVYKDEYNSRTIVFHLVFHLVVPTRQSVQTMMRLRTIRASSHYYPTFTFIMNIFIIRVKLCISASYSLFETIS